MTNSEIDAVIRTEPAAVYELRSSNATPAVFRESLRLLARNIERDVREAMNSWASWAAEEARTLLAGRNENASPNVIRHWKKLAALAPKERS